MRSSAQLYLDMTFHFRCYHCPVTEDVKVFGCLLGFPCYPGIPPGWHAVNEKLLCPAHTVVIVAAEGFQPVTKENEHVATTPVSHG